MVTTQHARNARTRKTWQLELTLLSSKITGFTGGVGTQVHVPKEPSKLKVLVVKGYWDSGSRRNTGSCVQ